MAAVNDATRHDPVLSHIGEALRAHPRRWLVTGSAGFIGSHLTEALLALGQHVVGLDNFATGFRRNLDEVRAAVGADAWRRHTFVEADIADPLACARACEGVDVVLHEAALGSVPRSLEDPQRTHAANATGFLNMLVAARDARVSRFVYAASSSTYGDHPALPKVEHAIGAPLSPYAVTKYLNELYADVFGRCYGLPSIGLRYFNVFGPRQDPDGAYAAVIPRFVSAMLRGEAALIHGDGDTSRDFCYVANVVQANLLAATVTDAAAIGQVYNVAVGERMSLNELHEHLRALIAVRHPRLDIPPPRHDDFRAGDVRHSQADIGKAMRLLGYRPEWSAKRGLAAALPWYEAQFAPANDVQEAPRARRAV
ncbi:MAG TPA: SDR family oxidoreductase [Casimicrobiaceae bacterium]|nr:SDR family oxidoreductase [Casimicrobiaceae bacterium]